MKKRILAILIGTVMTLSMVACGSKEESAGDASKDEVVKEDVANDVAEKDATADDDEIRIGFSLKTVQEEFWQKNLETLEELADEYGVTLITQIANNEPATQISQIENLATQDLDVLMVVAADGGTLSEALDKVHEQGIPILLYDQVVTNTYADAFMGYGLATMGNDIAAALADLGLDGNYVFLHGDASSGDNVTGMADGEKEMFADRIESGDITIVAEQWCTGWTAEQAQAHMENALTANNNDIQAVCCMNDNIAAGAINALEAAGIDPSTVPVTGMDGDLAALQRIAVGTQYSTLFKPANLMAEAGIEAAIKMAKGEDLGTNQIQNFGKNDMPWVELRGITVTSENLEEVVVDGGYYTYEQIYGEN